MQLFTSYFAKAGELKKKGIVPVSIALWSPKFFNGPSLHYLAPNRNMLKDGISNEEYTSMYYREILNRVDLNALLYSFKDIGQGRDVALLCYEKPGDFCHRRLFAQWYLEKTGEEIKEYSFAKEVKLIDMPVQKSLFD